jgi:hypothetical protein
MERLVAESGGEFDEMTRAELRLRKGRLFRLGEQENCLATHNADSCVFPLKPKAYHLLPRGSRGAIAMFNAHLAEFPDDFSALAAKPRPHDPRRISDKVNPRYHGLVGSLNIQQTDYNNDGLLDIWAMRGAWLGKAGRIPSSLLRNNGDGTFDVTEESGLLFFHPTQATRWFDYDGDGRLDLFVGSESTDQRPRLVRTLP